MTTVSNSSLLYPASETADSLVDMGIPKSYINTNSTTTATTRQSLPERERVPVVFETGLRNSLSTLQNIDNGNRRVTAAVTATRRARAAVAEAAAAASHSDNGASRVSGASSYPNRLGGLESEDLSSRGGAGGITRVKVTNSPPTSATILNVTPESNRHQTTLAPPAKTSHENSNLHNISGSRRLIGSPDISSNSKRLASPRQPAGGLGTSPNYKAANTGTTTAPFFSLTPPPSLSSGVQDSYSPGRYIGKHSPRGEVAHSPGRVGRRISQPDRLSNYYHQNINNHYLHHPSQQSSNNADRSNNNVHLSVENGETDVWGMTPRSVARGTPGGDVEIGVIRTATASRRSTVTANSQSAVLGAPMSEIMIAAMRGGGSSPLPPDSGRQTNDSREGEFDFGTESIQRSKRNNGGGGGHRRSKMSRSDSTMGIDIHNGISSDLGISISAGQQHSRRTTYSHSTEPADSRHSTDATIISNMGIQHDSTGDVFGSIGSTGPTYVTTATAIGGGSSNGKRPGDGKARKAPSAAAGSTLTTKAKSFKRNISLSQKRLWRPLDYHGVVAPLSTASSVAAEDNNNEHHQTKSSPDEAGGAAEIELKDLAASAVKLSRRAIISVTFVFMLGIVGAVFDVIVGRYEHSCDVIIANLALLVLSIGAVYFEHPQTLYSYFIYACIIVVLSISWACFSIPAALSIRASSLAGGAEPAELVVESHLLPDLLPNSLVVRAYPYVTLSFIGPYLLTLTYSMVNAMTLCSAWMRSNEINYEKVLAWRMDRATAQRASVQAHVHMQDW